MTTGVLIFGLIPVLFISIVNITTKKSPIQAQIETEPEIFRVRPEFVDLSLDTVNTAKEAVEEEE